MLLTERLLPAEDHGNLYVTSAFGVFAVALERAARSLRPGAGGRACVGPRPGHAAARPARAWCWARRG